MPKPDIKVFLSDPKHAEDREFFKSLLRLQLVEIAAEEKKKREESGEDESENLFDGLFDFNKK